MELAKTVWIDKSRAYERVLGMIWKPEPNTFVFQGVLREEIQVLLLIDVVPTKREVLQTVISIFDPIWLVATYEVQKSCSTSGALEWVGTNASWMYFYVLHSSWEYADFSPGKERIQDFSNLSHFADKAEWDKCPDITFGCIWFPAPIHLYEHPDSWPQQTIREYESSKTLCLIHLVHDIAHEQLLHFGCLL